MRRFLVVFMLVAFLVGVSFGAKSLMLTSWNEVVKYQGGHDFPVEPATVGRSGDEPRSLVLVIIDGLRADVAAELPNLGILRGRGASATALAGKPSLSLPGWTVISTGTWQEFHSVTTNWFEGPVKVDSLFASARRAGLRTVLIGDRAWEKLFGAYVDESIYLPGSDPSYDEKIFEGASRALIKNSAARKSSFMVVHFLGVDDVGHSYGGGSNEYREAALKIDGFLGQLLPLLTPDTTLVVTADHGHIKTGGHGGWEPEVLRVPLVLSGNRIRSGEFGEVAQADLAPTMAALLGISPPAHATGRILTEMISLREDELRTQWSVLSRQQQGFTGMYLKRLGPAGADAGRRLEAVNFEPGEEYLKQLTALRAEARDRRLKMDRLSRLPWIGGVGLLALLLLYLTARAGRAGTSVLAAAVYLGVWNALFFGRGYVYSLSVLNSEERIKAFFNARMLEAAVLTALVGLLVGFVFAWKRRYLAVEVLEVVATAITWPMVLLALQVLYALYLHGYEFSWFLPDLKLGFKYYLDLLQIVPMGLTSVPALILGLIGARVAAWVAPARKWVTIP